MNICFTICIMRTINQQIVYYWKSLVHKNYVFAELLGMTVTWNGLFKWLNLIPASIGGNIIVVGKKENISSIS